MMHAKARTKLTVGKIGFSHMRLHRVAMEGKLLHQIFCRNEVK